MNRIYTLTALLLVGGGLSAQRVNQTTLQDFGPTSHPMRLVRPIHDTPATQEASSRSIVFSEDFANGLAGNNGGVGPWTTSGANGNVWRYTTVGPLGAYTTRDELIASPTVANGYMLFNSDSANTNWADTTIVANPVQLVGSLVSPTIDLSGSPNVELQFSMRLRYCCMQDPGHYVEVSTDGGATWPTRINVDVAIPYYVTPNTDIATNDDSGTLTYRINLVNAISANPGTTRIRFTQEGTAANALTHYAWQVDDVQIQDLSATDMRAYAKATSFFNDSTAVTYDSLVYPIMPISELRGLASYLAAFNNGSTTATSTTAHFTTDDGYDQTVNLGDVAPGVADTAHVSAPGWVPTSTLGVHHMYFALNSDGTDANPTDNADTARVIVSQSVYARDEDSRDNNAHDTDDGAAFKVGSIFSTSVDETLYGIDVAFANISAVGIELDAQLLDPNTTNFDPIAETGYHTLATSDLTPLGGNHTVSFIFDQPVQLTAGTSYLPAIQHFGGVDVRVATSGTSLAHTSFIYRSSTSTWYYTTNTPMVRLNFSPTIGIAENDFQNGIGLGQNYPNPANTGSTRIDYSLDQSASVHMELRDISGKLVRSLVNGNMAPGVHHVVVNTADLDAGVYFYTLTSDKAVSTKRMTVVR